jgi:hypothetical protein
MQPLAAVELIKPAARRLVGVSAIVARQPAPGRNNTKATQSAAAKNRVVTASFIK